MNITEQLRGELAVLLSDRARYAGELRDIERRSADSEDLSPGLQQRWTDTEKASDRAAERMLQIEAELSDRSRRVGALHSAIAVSGDGAAALGQARSGNFSAYDGRFNIGRGRDLTEIYDRGNLDTRADEHGNAFRSKALGAIDSWRSATPEAQESAARLVENCDLSRQDRVIADHILGAGNPVYVRAFSKYLRYGPTAVGMFSRDEQEVWSDLHSRAMNEGSVGAGQAIVPPFLDPAIILTNTGIVNPFRQLSTVKTITTQTWKGVTSAGVTAEWTAEAAEATDASPTFTSPSITPARGDAYVQASFEMLEDTNIGTDIAMLFADARDRLEGAAFAVGTGSTQPRGVVTALGLTTASRTAALSNAGPIQLADLYALDGNLPPRFRPNASWVGAKGILNLIRQATIPSLTNFSPWVDFGGAMPSKAIGYPVYEASGMLNSLSTATASNDDCLVLGDFRQGFTIVDRLPLTIAYNPVVIGSNRRPTGEVGWFCVFRVGSDVTNPAAFQMLRA